MYYVSPIQSNDIHLRLARVINFRVFPIITDEIFETTEKEPKNQFPEKKLYQYTN